MVNEQVFGSLIDDLLVVGGGERTSLPSLSRLAIDPGENYFLELKQKLKLLFALLEGKKEIPRNLASALFGISHLSYMNYLSAKSYGKSFRTSLLDSDMIEIEMAVDSIFSGLWIEL